MQQRYGTASTNATAFKNNTAWNLARLQATAHLTTFESIFFHIICDIDRKYRVMNFHTADFHSYVKHSASFVVPWILTFYFVLNTIFGTFHILGVTCIVFVTFHHCVYLPAKKTINRSNIVYTILWVCAKNSLRTFSVSVGLSLSISRSHSVHLDTQTVRKFYSLYG